MQDYDFVLLTNIPAFYKVRLWNEINKHKRVLMIFNVNNEPTRNADFISAKCSFDTITVNGNVLHRACTILKLLSRTKYEKLFFSGWNDLANLIVANLMPKSKNAVIVESTIFEHKQKAIKDFLKRMLLRRISYAYTPGTPHEQLLRRLGYEKQVIQTGGCGLLNYIPQPACRVKKEVKNFIFVGRLVSVKNLHLLIRAFNRLPDLNLTIVGFGELETELKKEANNNISFTGSIDNALLPKIYQRHDVFLLCSYSETWGLVVEEALNNGLPVIVSDHVGCRMDLVTEGNGLIFQHDSLDSLIDCIKKMTDIQFYNQLSENVSKMDFKKRVETQINSYIS